MTYEVYVAGTFNVLTEGHKKLLSIAVREMEEFRHLSVYVTNDMSYFKDKEVPVRAFERRCGDVRRYLTYEHGLEKDQFEIWPLQPTSEKKARAWWSKTDVLVCSSETRNNAEGLLSKIPESNRPKLVVLERDKAPSSTDIIKKSLSGERVEVVRW